MPQAPRPNGTPLSSIFSLSITAGMKTWLAEKSDIQKDLELATIKETKLGLLSYAAGPRLNSHSRQIQYRNPNVHFLEYIISLLFVIFRT